MCVSILRVFGDKNVKRNTIVGLFDLKTKAGLFMATIYYIAAQLYITTPWPHPANYAWALNFKQINKYENIK